MSAGNPFIGLRLEPDVLEFLDQQAASFGLSRPSFLRFLISMSPILVEYYEDNVTADNYVATPLVMLADLNQIRVELKKQGNNLNQSIKAMNSLALSVKKRKDDDIPMLLNGIHMRLHEAADSYDEFNEMFAQFEKSVFALRGDGHVRAQKH